MVEFRIASLVAVLAASAIMLGCQSASEHAADVQKANATDDKLTVGRVQREIRVGMSSADVVGVLGSPNMVTTDSQRRENWVYDKVATQNVYSRSSGGVNSLILGGALIGSGLLGGAAGGGYSGAAGASSTTQRTLTIIIKFDEKSQVRDFAYRSSSF